MTAQRLNPTDPAAMTAFGHLLESWVIAEVERQLGWSDGFVQFGDFRTGRDVEVDLVIERDDGRVAAIEIKASSTVHARDGAGLRFLRERLGSRFAAGWLLHLGAHQARLGEDIIAAPVTALWS